MAAVVAMWYSTWDVRCGPGRKTMTTTMTVRTMLPSKLKKRTRRKNETRPTNSRLSREEPAQVASYYYCCCCYYFYSFSVAMKGLPLKTRCFEEIALSFVIIPRLLPLIDQNVRLLYVVPYLMPIVRLPSRNGTLGPSTTTWNGD